MRSLPQVLQRPLGHFLPLNDKEYFRTGDIDDPNLTVRSPVHSEYMQLFDMLQVNEIAKFSKKDAEAWPKYLAMLDKQVDVVRDIIDMTPPNAGGGD